jgi:hypothetical protein
VTPLPLQLSTSVLAPSNPAHHLNSRIARAPPLLCAAAAAVPPPLCHRPRCVPLAWQVVRNLKKYERKFERADKIASRRKARMAMAGKVRLSPLLRVLR